MTAHSQSRAMWMRGGTSKGGYFLAEDLPVDTAARDAGAPDGDRTTPATRTVGTS